MMSCMTAKLWNRIHYKKFFRLDKRLLCGVTGTADLAFEQGIAQVASWRLFQALLSMNQLLGQ